MRRTQASLRIGLSWFLLTLAFACTAPREKSISAIAAAEKELFSDSSGTPDSKKAMDVYALYTTFADTYKQDSLSAEYLFRAADLAQGVRHYRLAMDCYEVILKNHASSKKAAAALFMEGFVYQDGLQQPDSAKMKYRLFLERYPTHTLASSAKSLLDQLQAGWTDEQLIRMWEQKQDSAKRVN